MKHLETTHFGTIEACVDDIIATLGNEIRMATPLGLGKPNQLVNALYRRAKQDPSLKFSLYTALSLAKPSPSSDLEARFLNPFIDRVFGDFPDMDYVKDLADGTVPDNIKVCEFFCRPGSYLKSPQAQQSYVSSNYTHVARDLVDQGVNLVAQIIAKTEIDGETKYSLSCNPDVALDIVPVLQARESQGGEPFLVVGQVNNNLPFMYNDAMVDESTFEGLIDNPEYDFKLFGPPRMNVSDADYMIGLHASALIRDGGTLQVGIGSLGDAIVYATNLRHQENSEYKQLLNDAGVSKNFQHSIDAYGGTNVFEKGLYGSTEMFVDGFMHLYRTGVLKRRVYDNKAIQKLLNEGRITEEVNPETFRLLLDEGVIDTHLTRREVDTLKKFGIFKANVSFKDQSLHCDGHVFTNDLSAKANLEQILAHCLGDKLQGGIFMHGGFFLGPADFYEFLHDLSEEERLGICMTSVGHVNQLYGGKAELKAMQRQDARFINTCLMVTLSGAVVSDGLQDNQILSGVGGQYNFVSMAHAVPGGRSIIMVRAVRNGPNGPESNIVWEYPHCTIPRHLRDIVISEYGIAELRGKTDAEIVQELLNITDSRFQPTLLAKAKAAGKVAADYQIPEQFQNNLPQRISGVLNAFREQGKFPAFPFGTDLNDMELALGKALKALKARTDAYRFQGLQSWWRARSIKTVPQAAMPFLQRMDLADEQDDTRLAVIRKLLVLELQEGGAI